MIDSMITKEIAEDILSCCLVNCIEYKLIPIINGLTKINVIYDNYETFSHDLNNLYAFFKENDYDLKFELFISGYGQIDLTYYQEN